MQTATRAAVKSTGNFIREMRPFEEPYAFASREDAVKMALLGLFSMTGKLSAVGIQHSSKDQNKSLADRCPLKAPFRNSLLLDGHVSSAAQAPLSEVKVERP
jgi:hypothetical protein